MRGAVLFALGTSIRATLDHKIDYFQPHLVPYIKYHMTGALETVIIICAVIAVVVTLLIVCRKRW